MSIREIEMNIYIYVICGLMDEKMLKLVRYLYV